VHSKVFLHHHRSRAAVPSWQLLLTLASLPAPCVAQVSAPIIESETPTFGTTVVIPGGLRGEVYHLPSGASKLPNFEKLKPVGVIYTAELNISPRSFKEGFPGVTDRIEWFAIDYKGKFWIDKPGSYRFLVNSDDGARLYIDDRRVIENDGIHGPETAYGNAKLSFGIHSIRLSYFQGPRYELALVLAVAPPGGTWQVFNTNIFKPPPNPEDWDGLAALHAEPMPHDFELRLAAIQFHNQSTSWQGALVVDAPALPVRLHLLALIKNARGQVTSQYSLDPPPESQNHPITWTQVLELAQGHYTVEAVAVEHDGKRASVSTIPIDTPRPRPGVDLSRVILARLGEPANGFPFDPLVYQGRHVVPMLAPAWNGAGKPSVYFVVYSDQSNPVKPTLRVEFLVDGRSLADQSADLPQDIAGPIPVFVEADAQPGDCELRITAIQGKDSATETVHYAVPPR
jgi:hypothetical protein